MIKLIVVGKMNHKYLNQGIEYYKKQLPQKLEIIEIKDGKNEQAVHDEGKSILKHIEQNDYVISLAINGKTYTSELFSKHLENILMHQHHDVIFIIGGSYGLSDEVYERTNERLSFSDMTFPHQLMRLMFIEQLYRAFMIMKHHPYHK
jgi:23S rRNA (pseudouridine1915-N3)-methyltransferase